MQHSPNPAGRHARDSQGNGTARSVAKILSGLVAVGLLAVVAVWFVNYVANVGESQKIEVAKAGLQKIETAVTAYKIKAGSLPDSLQALLPEDPSDPPTLRDADLLDPWHHPYVYDPSQLDPVNQRPLIYSLGPKGDENTMIRNWSE